MFITFNQFKKALLAVKRYITAVMPKRTSDLLNDSGYIASAAFNINVTYSNDTYTGDKTFQEISDAIASGQIPQVMFEGSLFKFVYQSISLYSFEYVYLDTVNDQVCEYHNFLTVSFFDSWNFDESVTIIPQKVSDLTNDAGYLTSYTETDPTVPSWAKAETKPTYTASEVGAATNTHTHGNITNAGDITATATIANGDRLVINDESASRVTNSSITFGTGTTTFLANNGTWQTPSGAVTSVNGSTGAVNLTIPTKVSDLTNDSGFITDAGVTSFNGATGDVTYSAVTYTLSISNNVITLTGSDGSTSSVTLPVYAGGVSS